MNLEPRRYYAHTPREGGEWHGLGEHLESVAALAASFAKKFGGEDMAYVAGLLHDIGKYNPAFQSRLQTLHEERHAVYGAIMALEEGAPEIALPILGHHSGLPSRGKLQEALANPEICETYKKVVLTINGCGVNLRGVRAALGVSPFGDRLEAEMFLRMVFSALVDADFLDTEQHFDPVRSVVRAKKRVLSPSELWRVLRENQEQLLAAALASTVNLVRGEVYRFAVEAADSPRGVFRLSVPTGGGKTRSGLGFALRHAAERAMDQVIVAVPFISITDQTAQVYRGIFGDENVLEHHSAIQAEVTERNKLATQNWDAPLVVTTTVQLLESLLSNRPSRCRKLHNVTNSVIVLDEVQTLPPHLLDPITDVLDELVRRYGCTVVLSTATQPPLRWAKDVHDIVPPKAAESHFAQLKRVSFELPDAPWSWDQAAEALAEHEQAMAVVNTRANAIALLDRVPQALLARTCNRTCSW